MDLDHEDSSASSSSSSSHSNPKSHHFSFPPPCTATASKRKAGRKKFRETRHPVYRGVRQRNGNKWVCEVREPLKKSRIWLGTYPTPEMAARAHDVAALALRGRFASLNFPDSAWNLPPAKSSSAEDIQAAALEAANAFKPPPPSSSSSSTNSGLATTSRVAASKKVQAKDVEFASADSGSSQNVPDGSTTVFLDEEALFNMPGLIDSMAEGLLLTPPALSRGFNWDDTTSHINLSLWDDD